ncbi:uncharacterized protein PAC_09409 [Phialocephala subalpina]|uniref:Uncharacterized protein n=1 Tax=Phialocephala subalpina TaxID=576137 RepID=A0A1L7X3F4_9HELO|nr:uncharacterized protein PAC_09409 [Phialocephala subalpina]
MATASASTSGSCAPQTPNIPLRRLVSRNSIFKRSTPSIVSTSSTTTTLPDYSSFPLPSYDSLSINTEASLLPSPASIQNFAATSALQIQTQGKAAISFPLPSKELEIPIIDPEDEGTGPKYLSVRAKRRSGSGVLMQGDTQVACTTCAFGLGRNPVIRIGKTSPSIEDQDGDLMEVFDEEVDEFEMQGKSLLTRTITFNSPKWGTFEWRYAGRRERALADPSGKKSIHNLLVLEKVMGKGESEQRIKVAQLIRSEETRTPGTRKSCAGNGGRLEMCLSGGGMEEGILVDDVTVVVTVLVMLKKEIDRLRAIQIAAMSAGGGGGGC